MTAGHAQILESSILHRVNYSISSVCKHLSPSTLIHFSPQIAISVVKIVGNQPPLRRRLILKLEIPEQMFDTRTRRVPIFRKFLPFFPLLHFAGLRPMRVSLINHAQSLYTTSKVLSQNSEKNWKTISSAAKPSFCQSVWSIWAKTRKYREKIQLSLIHIWRCRRSTLCRSRWSPYH